MPYGAGYRVQLRRRRQKKTDYQARKGFVVSGKPRLVARSSMKNTIAQIVIAKPKGDEVVASAHSRELIKKYGWKAATGNIPAAYLTGLLCGLKAKKNGVTEAILDLGLVSPTKGSKVFSTLSGVVDAGVEIPHDEDKIIKDRIQGYHIQDYAESLGAPEEFAPKFSTYQAKNVAPQRFNEHFIQVRNAILTEYGMPIPKAEPRAAKPKKPQPKAPEPKKPEAKPVKTEAAPEPKPVAPAPKPEAKPEPKPEAKAAPAPTAEAKKPEAAEVKPKAEPEKKPKTEVAKPKPEAEAKPKAAKAEAKPKAGKAEPKAKAAKKAPAKTKAKKAEKEAETVPEAKVKREGKKPTAKEAGVKPAKKTAKKTGEKKA